MKPVFADSFYYLALINPDDKAHRSATILSHNLVRKVITTTWVLTEIADALSAPRWRSVFFQVYEVMRFDPSVLIVPATHELFEAGVDLLSNRPDKEWSLTDCISFHVMSKFKITEALTRDHHFKQAGFNCLM